MMLKYPEQFSIRKEIVTMFITSFYKLLWNKNEELSKKLELDILTGDHNESAFVEVRSEKVFLILILGMSITAACTSFKYKK